MNADTPFLERARGFVFYGQLPCPGRAQRRMKITPTPPSPVEGEGYREGGIFRQTIASKDLGNGTIAS